MKRFWEFKAVLHCRLGRYWVNFGGLVTVKHFLLAEENLRRQTLIWKCLLMLLDKSFSFKLSFCPGKNRGRDSDKGKMSQKQKNRGTRTGIKEKLGKKRGRD
jgi:hypothetical protein